MRCPICRFENMPGESPRCARCGTALSAASGLAADFMPPRATGGRRRRTWRYRFNAAVDDYPDWRVWRVVRALTGVETFPGAAVVQAGLSVVPGLGHWVGGRRLAALIAFGVWAALGALTVHTFGSAQTGATLGLLIGWHAVVIFDAGPRRHLERVGRRGLVLAIGLLLIAVPYILAHDVVYSLVDFVRMPLADASCGLEAEDLVLISRGRFALADLDIGEVVAFVATGNGSTRIRENVVLELDAPGAVVGRIAALAGERVEISPQGMRRDPEQYESTAWRQPGLPLPTEAVTLQVPEGHVLIPVPIELPQGSVRDSAVLAIWTKMFTVEPSEIRGKALLVYQPTGRRHVIRTRELSRE